MQENKNETPVDFSEQINQRNNKNSNKPIFKVRVKDPNNTKNTLIYFTTKIDKTNVSYLEFIGYPTSTKEISSYEELMEFAKDKGLEEVILTKPWHQVIDIETVKSRRK